MRSIPKSIAIAANGKTAEARSDFFFWVACQRWHDKYLTPRELHRLLGMSSGNAANFWLLLAKSNGKLPKRLKRKKTVRIKKGGRV